jgi:hypothetical protein
MYVYHIIITTNFGLFICHIITKTRTSLQFTHHSSNITTIVPNFPLQNFTVVFITFPACFSYWALPIFSWQFHPSYLITGALARVPYHSKLTLCKPPVITWRPNSNFIPPMHCHYNLHKHGVTIKCSCSTNCILSLLMWNLSSSQKSVCLTSLLFFSRFCSKLNLW